MQSTLKESATDAVWCELSPQLDEAMAGLGTSERDALVLRYFQNRSMAEVGKFLGLAENTAQKRVSRALEKLRKFFAKRGVASTTAIIAGAISAHSVHAAPAALAKSITAIALTKGAAVSGSTLTLVKGALKIMAWTKTKTAVAAAVAVVLLTGTTITVVLKSHSSAQLGFQSDPSRLMTFATSEKAPADFAAWTFFWRAPKQAADSVLDYVVTQPDGQEYFRWKGSEHRTRLHAGEAVRSDFCPGFAGGDPHVFYNETIRFTFQASKGGLIFNPPESNYYFAFYKTMSDLRAHKPFKTIQASQEQP